MVFGKLDIMVEKENFMKQNAGNGAVYGLGFIGSAVYFIGHAATFGAGVLGFLKAIVWPAILMYQAFQFLNK